MALTKTQISELYVSIFNRASEKSGSQNWLNSGYNTDATAMANAMLATDAAKEYFGTSLLTDAAFVEHIYINTLNKGGADVDAAGKAGWVEFLEAGHSRGEMVVKMIEAIKEYQVGGSKYATADQATKNAAQQFANRVEVSDYTADTLETIAVSDINSTLSFSSALTVTADAATVTTAKAAVAKAAAAANKGQAFQLTDGRDFITGKDGNDTITGFVGQNKDGALANAFATGDYIDGGAGTDTLFATLMNDNEVDSGTNFDINVRTKNVEIAKFEVLDEGVVVDAGNMDSVREFWSVNSDDSGLTLEDVRLGSKLSITKDITFGMKDVDYGSDLTARLDSNSFKNSGEKKFNSKIVVEVGDSNKDAGSTNPLELIKLTLEFTFGGQDYKFADMTSVDGTYEGLKATITSKLAEVGLNGLVVEFGSPLTEIVAKNDTVNLLYSGAKQIIITDPNGAAFTNFKSGVSAIASQESSNPVSNTSAQDPNQSSTLIESNLILDNAGRGSTAGDVVIGAMSNSDAGIEQFNVTVQGTNGSAIESLKTTNNKLQNIIIKSAADSTASLEIGATQDNLKLIDAAGFTGTNLMLGTTVEALRTGLDEDVTNVAVADVKDLTTLNANIASNVTFNAEVAAGANYTYTTGTGNDTIKVKVDGDAVDTNGEGLAINAGNGDNTVTVSMGTTNGTDARVSVATTQWLNNLSITTGSGVDKVELKGGSDKATQVDTLSFSVDTTDANDESITITLDVDGDGASNTAIVVDLSSIDVTNANTIATTVATAVAANITVAAAVTAGTITLGAVAGNSFTITYNDGLTHDVAAQTAQSNLDTLAATVTTADTKITTDGDADFNISTGAASDFVYINSIGDADTQDAAKGTWTVGATSTTGVDFGDAYTGAAGINGKVLYKATLTINFAGFEQTVTIDTTNANNFVATQTDINNAIKKAIAANPELSKLLTTTDGTGHQQLTINSTVEGLNQLSIAVNQPALAAVATGAVVAISSTDILALQKGLISTGEAANSTAVTDTTEALTIAKIADIIDGTAANGANAITVGANGAAGGNLLAAYAGGSANETAVTNVSVIDLGKGANDLVVLNSDVDSVNTVKFSAAWDKVSIVNFEKSGLIAATDVTGSHKLDFTAFLGNQTDASANTNALSALTIARTVNSTAEVVGNDVIVINNFAETSATVGTWAGLTAANLLAAIQETNTGAANYGSILETTLENDTATANLIGSTIKSIVMIENDKNAGEYKVFELTAKEDAGAVNGDFTAAVLLGIIDFGDEVTLVNANLA